MRITRVLVLAGLTSPVIGLAGCGGSNPPPPPECLPGQTGPNCPDPCKQSSVYSDSGPIDKNTLEYFDFSVPEAGRLDMTLNWTHDSSPIGLYLVPANTCTLDQFNARSCNFLVRSEPPGLKPRKVSAANIAAGNYRWMIGNFNDVKESASLQIVLSKGDCPPLAGAEPSASAHESTLPLTFAHPRW